MDSYETAEYNVVVEKDGRNIIVLFTTDVDLAIFIFNQIVQVDDCDTYLLEDGVVIKRHLRER